MRILFCEDEPDQRARYKDQLEGQWRELQNTGIVAESLELDTYDNIVTDSATANEDAILLRDVGQFDAILLDIVWKRSNDESRGVSLAELVREEYPEMPIMMFTVSTDPKLYDRLLRVGIATYISKGERSPKSLCLQIKEGLDRARKARRGHCLYKLIRQVTSKGAWQADCVGKAASGVWRSERPHDRWEAFWQAFSQPIAKYRLSQVFQQMRRFFENADLFMQGSVPGMRGHLEHVLNVYFTGYVISNLNTRFRENAIKAARRLFPDTPSTTDEQHWDLFQLAWLAAATLHDTAYPLEILPDIYARCSEIKQLFATVLSTETDNRDAPRTHGWQPQDSKVLRRMSELLVELRTETELKFLENHLTFEKRPGEPRVNHGVASGLLFASKAAEVASLPNQSPDLAKYLTWAGVAMAMHSLKKPGSQKGVRLSISHDPLSYLLMICDEIQVWERERPDTSIRDSPFKATDLVHFDVSESSIVADVAYYMYDNIGREHQAFNDTRDEFDASFVEDGMVLDKYLDGDGLKVKIARRIPAFGYDFTDVVF